MREVLFRAKRIDDGEWIEGFLFSTNEHTYIAYPNQFDDDLFLSPKEIFIEVDPETICQYTGLTDKNGRKIFERDILKIPERKNQTLHIEYGQFCDALKPLIAYIRPDCEVIGNIFDNPELIGEQP